MRRSDTFLQMAACLTKLLWHKHIGIDWARALLCDQAIEQFSVASQAVQQGYGFKTSFQLQKPVFPGPAGGMSFLLYVDVNDYTDIIYNNIYDEGFKLYANYEPHDEV